MVKQTKKKEGAFIAINNLSLALLLGLVALPVAATLLHIKLHPQYVFLTYIALFDAIAITLLYLFRKTIFLGFILNTVLFIAGIIAHLKYVPGGGLTDILLSIPDFSIGYALWSLNNG